MPNGRRVRKEEALEHEARAWSLRQRGLTHELIAAEIGVTQGAVCGILKRVSDRVKASSEETVRQIKLEHTAVLEYALSEAMAAWEASKAPRKVITRRQVKGPQGDEVLEEVVTQQASEQTGDVAYLTQARAALDEIRRIWGADAPVKSEVANPGGGLLRIIAVEAVAPPGVKVLELEAKPPSNGEVHQ